jgi:hypothetical protein
MSPENYVPLASLLSNIVVIYQRSLNFVETPNIGGATIPASIALDLDGQMRTCLDRLGRDEEIRLDCSLKRERNMRRLRATVVVDETTLLNYDRTF